MIEIEKAFNPETRSVQTFFQRPGVGFYIPLYQREYSWDSDNVEQLKDDIEKGIENLLENDRNEIRFLGTIITVIENNKRNIEPRDPTGLPSGIEKVIDGQQRLSTVAVFGTLLYHHLHNINEKLVEEEVRDEIAEITGSWKDKIVNLFSLDLGRGTPRIKPKIIRGSKDTWTKDGDIEMYYKSDIASYLAKAIRYVDEGGAFPKSNSKDKLGKNIRNLDKWLKNDVLEAHVNQSTDFKAAWEIVDKISQENIWDYDRNSLCEYIKKRDSDPKSLSYKLSSLVQLLSVCHYLLERCCFTTIQPSNDDWAFDMFQSLNATGTPLTAIETFQPIVVKTTEDNGESYKNSRSFESFNKIQSLFEDTDTASKKSRRASDFLTSFRIAIDGEKLENHFSKQRKWIVDFYENEMPNYDRRKDFINYFGNYAEFYKEVWLDYNGKEGRIKRIAAHPESEIASFLVLYLKDSNHKMAATILGYFYNGVIRGENNSVSSFIEAVKVVSAFYTLWRSAQGNAGLDSIYRNIFRTTDKDGGQGNGWKFNSIFEVDSLKSYLQKVLQDRGLWDKHEWLSKAKPYCKYSHNTYVCRFAIFISSHDTIVDDEKQGLMKIGSPNASPYLNVERWISKDLKTIEHIAPVVKSEGWDENLYDENNLFQSIGNLTLLPIDINVSAGNKSWPAKLLYYKNLAENDPAKRQEIINKAQEANVNLADETIKILNAASYNLHIKPIVSLDPEDKWDKKLVESRRDRILEIVWNRLISWLN